MLTIWGKYRDAEPERIDSAATPQEAEYLLNEYQLAFGAKPGQPHAQLRLCHLVPAG